MNTRSYLTELRTIRERIGQATQDMPWEEWQQRIREEVSRHPELARMLTRAVPSSDDTPSLTRTHQRSV